MQFGKPLAEFQAVRFTIADASVAARGLYELAKYTISRVESSPAQIRSADALILRLKAADTARQVLRTAHQLLGALGFCDESDVSVLDRHTQSLIRLPVSTEVLALRLMPGVRGGQLRDTVLGPSRVTRRRRCRRAMRRRRPAGENARPTSAAISNLLDEGIPFGTKLAELAEQRRDEPAVTIVALDGTAHSLTFGELDARANQWGRALAANGAGYGFSCCTCNPEFCSTLCWPRWGAGRSARFPFPCTGICPNGSETGCAK